MNEKSTRRSVKVCYVGCPGFPVGFAEVERIKLISKALLKSGVDVTVLSRKGLLDPRDNASIAPKGFCEGIAYLYASGSAYRPNGYLKRNLLKFKGLINEISILRRWANDNATKCLLLSTRNFSDLIFYLILAKILGIKSLLNSVELDSSIIDRNSVFMALNDYLFERIGYRLVNGALPISTFLLEFIRKVAPGTPILKVPVLCDTEKFMMESDGERNFFLFCGSARYLEVITFILSAFDLLESKSDVGLILICHGTKEEMKCLDKEIRKRKNASVIKVMTRLPYEELAKLYKEAKALLIPLRPTIQDKARFPHKIAEYAAAGRPMITTAYGEIPYYFKDMQTALIAKSYDQEEFAAKMAFALQNPDAMVKIGSAARTLAEEEFHYLRHGQRILAFICSIAGLKSV